MRNTFLFVLVLVCGVPAVNAQESPPRIQPTFSTLFTEHLRTWSEAAASDSTAGAVPPTHWKKGLLIGGVIGTVGLGAFVYVFCEALSETRESCLGPALGGAAVGAVVGGTVGALIGGQFPVRDDTVAVPDTTKLIRR